MQADTVADEFRRQHHAFDRLRDAEDGDDADEVRHVLKLQQRHAARKRHADDKAEIRHEAHQAGEDADGNRHVEAECGQADGVDEAEAAHHQQLPAQKAAEDFIGAAHQERYRANRIARHQFGGLCHHRVPVAQHIKGNHRHQHQIADEADNPVRRPRHLRQHILQKRRRRAEIVLDGGNDVVNPELAGGDVKQRGKPRQRALLQPLAIVGQLADDAVNLPTNRRNHHQHNQREKQKNAAEHRDHRRRARQAPALQAINQRIAQISEQRRQEKRCEDRS